MTRSSTSTRVASTRGRVAAACGLITLLVALALLVLLGGVAPPSSVSDGAILGMPPFAAVLAIASLGETRVMMQGGIDLSVAGTITLVVVIITHPDFGSDEKMFSAVRLALGAESFGIPKSVYFAVVAVIVTSLAVKRTVAGRRFRPVVAQIRLPEVVLGGFDVLVKPRGDQLKVLASPALAS